MRVLPARASRRALLFAAFLAAVAALASVGTSTPPLQASGPPNPDLSIEVVGAPGCTTDQDPPTASCNAPAGTFTVRVRLNSIAGLPDQDGDTLAGYTGVQAVVNHSAGLTFRKAHQMGVWPDCAYPSLANDSAYDTIYMGCIVAYQAQESLHLGPVIEAEFDCPTLVPSSESITLVHGQPLQSFILDDNDIAVLDKDSPETLNVYCTEPPPPPPPPPIDGTMAIDCDAFADGVQDTCTRGTGSEFDVLVHVVEPPTGGFNRFGVRLDVGQLEYLPTIEPADEALWIHCDFAFRVLTPVHLDCISSALPSGDTTAGPVAKFRIGCEQPGMNSVVFHAGGSALIPASGLPNQPGLLGATVNCVALVVGGTGSLPDVDVLPRREGGPAFGLLAGAAAAAAGITVAGTWALRRRWFRGASR